MPAVGPDELRRIRMDFLLSAPVVQLSDAGGQVLAGRSDHVPLNGIDRWIGGVHLQSPDVAWRWDDGTETLVPQP